MSSTRNPYDVLGVRRDASPDEVRRRYRERARVLHPDRTGDNSMTAMAELNNAYRVLSDPTRRAEYDRAQHTPTPSERPSGEPFAATVPVRTPSFPWRFVWTAVALGTCAVILSAALAGPLTDVEPDGVIRSGSCVEIDSAGFAREVACSGANADQVVRDLVPTDAVCGDGTVGYLDRLGLGRVCLNSP